MLNFKKILILCVLSCISSSSTEPAAKPIGVYFVLSARNLPDTDNLGTGSPDPYVDLEYYGGIYSTTKPFKTNTSMIANSHNPDWPEIFYLRYHAGGMQSIKFAIYDHNRITSNKPVGHVTVNIRDLTTKGSLDLALISDKSAAAGKLQIHTRMEGSDADAMDPRLRTLKNIHNIGGYYEVHIKHVQE